MTGLGVFQQLAVIVAALGGALAAGAALLSLPLLTTAVSRTADAFARDHRRWFTRNS